MIVSIIFLDSSWYLISNTFGKLIQSEILSIFFIENLSITVTPSSFHAAALNCCSICPSTGTTIIGLPKNIASEVVANPPAQTIP